MLGLMQSHPLLVSSILRHAARHHGAAEIVSRGNGERLHRTTYAATEPRARTLAGALATLGVRTGDRVATLAWNGFRHLEIYYAASGMGAICHTVNPRLGLDDIAYIINDAQDHVLFVDTSFLSVVNNLVPLVRETVHHVVLLADPGETVDIPLAATMTLHDYEMMMAAAEPIAAWPLLDENTASGLCYTSGTTGRPKGVLYSHRSTVLHAFAINMADVLGFRAVDRVLPVVPMFHVNAWGLPFAAPMAGASLVLPGRLLDGASLTALMNAEGVTVSAGVPTVWLGLLQHLERSGERLTSLRRIATGGSAAPRVLIERFGAEYGVRVEHAWGMTECSPIGLYNRPKPCHLGLDDAARVELELRQGRGIYGIDIKIVGDDGTELPWDRKTFGNLLIRGSTVCSRYFGDAPGGADGAGWFATGDVATIDPEGYVLIVDRSKDVIKSGGEWISSIALENIAVSHPDVAEAAIIAARHPKWLERPLLLVVAKTDREIDPDAMRDFFRDKVASWWLPDAVLVVDELPHTATGKLHKLVLRQRYAGVLEARVASNGG
jgi:fatty-acyl-CoA synthase